MLSFETGQRESGFYSEQIDRITEPSVPYYYIDLQYDEAQSRSSSQSTYGRMQLAVAGPLCLPWLSTPQICPRKYGHVDNTHG